MPSLATSYLDAFVSSFSKATDKVDRFLARPTAKYALTAAAASAITLASVLGTQALQRRRRARRLKREVLSAATSSAVTSTASSLLSVYDDGHSGLLSPSVLMGTTAVSATTGGPPSTDSPIKLSPDEEDLVREQLSRNISFLGDEGVQRVRDSFVIVVGCGGVGSWAALMLLRSGVERVRVIDFDQVTLSSLNRHAVATRADVGIPKVVSLKRHMREIVPHAVVDAKVELFTLQAAETLLEGNPDYVLDCIDNVKTKLELLKYCHDKKLPVISSMGAGAKADPSRVQISDISDTFEDPLARATRRTLRKMGVEQGITVVYSTEKPGRVGLVPLDESQIEKPEDFATLPSFRVRILPVLGTLPAIFGMSMASFIILKLAHFPVDPLAIKLRDGLYQRLQRDVRVREDRTFNTKTVALDVADVGYIFDEIFRGKSVVSGSIEKLAITRWDRRQPISVQNCVVLTKAEADAHDEIDGVPEDFYPPEVLRLVKQRMDEEARCSAMR